MVVGRPSSHAPPAPATSTSRWRRPEARRSSSIAPWATTRPRLMITTSSQTSSTRSSWWTRTRRRRRPRPAPGGRPAIVAMPIGSRPRERLVEDEQLRVVDERRRELDALLVAVGEVLELGLRPVPEAEALQPRAGLRPRVARDRPWCWAK